MDIKDSIAGRLTNFDDSHRCHRDPMTGASVIEGKVMELLAAPAPPDWQATGVTRGSYLDMMEIVVNGAKDWVDSQGTVIDPVLRKETGQTTPRFAAPGAILLHFGRAPEVRDAVFRAMDYCCQALPSGKARTNSPDFWMRELATAYMALETVAEPDQLARWAAGISAVEPEKIYTQVSPDGTRLEALGNWAIYAAAGEAMREAAGLKPAGKFLWGNDFFDRYVGAQLACFTEYGMYRDPGDPITYDVTTRLQIACGLVFGYDGKHREALMELLRRGGLTTLLFALPEGYCPYGGRSAAFNFRETILSALCELEARRHKTSNPRLAGAFRRQAHLSFLSVQRWMAGMKPWRHIKNGFDPAARHGIDAYGSYSVYSLLAASFAGLAAVFADESIAEAPCPAEIGGYAFELAPAFHKVFANCQGSCLEIDIAADPHYDATGLGCFAFRGVPLELGLGMPFSAHMEKWGAPAIMMGPGCKQPAVPVAIGSAWPAGEKWISLAELSDGLQSRFEAIEETSTAIRFSMTYNYGSTEIIENYTLAAGRLTINVVVTEAGRPVPKLRFTVPLLVTDGDAKSEIFRTDANKVCVAYRDHTYSVAFGAGVTAEIAEEEYSNRNGVYRSLTLENTGNEIRVELELG